MIVDSPLPAAVAAHRNAEVTAEHVRIASDQVSELIRYLNHATLPWSAPAALPSPADTTRLIGVLHEITRYLCQTVEQTGAQIAAARSDREEARLAVRHLEAAQETLRQVTRQLAQSHGAAAQLSGEPAAD
jgi:hypothetical protein